MTINEAIMYLRKSRDDIEREQRTGEDVLQLHRTRLSEFLTGRGIKWAERAEVKSGDTIKARPVFQKVLKEDIPSGQYQAICVTEISRLGRGDMEDAGRIYKTLIRYNIWVITPHKDYNPQNPADLRQIRFELFLSREEYELIKERLWSARDQRAKQGFAANYIVTLGYDQNRGRVFVIPEEAELVREIFEMRADNMSYQEIADVLNQRGLITKRGTQYYSSTIQKIIKNQRYIGKSKWRGQYYNSQAPAIVPLELWNQVHREVNPNRTVRKKLSRLDNPYLVELYCHDCGSRMYGERAVIDRVLANGQYVRYNEYGIYVCVGRKNKENKCVHRVRAELVHDAVRQELSKMAYDKAIIKELIRDRQRRLEFDTGGLQDKIDSKNNQIKQKEAFLLKCKEDYKKGELAAALYSEFYEDTIKEIDVLKAEIKTIKRKLEKATIKVESPELVLQKLRATLDDWEHIPNRDKKITIASFLPRVEISKNGVLFIERIIPPIFGG